MKIRDAWQAYNVQLDTLRDQKRSLAKLLEEQSGAAAETDRVEISKELARVDAAYEAVFHGREEIIARDVAIANGEAAKQQSEVLSKQAEEMGKIMEIYRRIASGAKVPAQDEKKLMDYNHELYMAAKTAAMMAERSDKEYDSLWDVEEEDSGETKSPTEIAGDTEITVPAPETVAAEVAAEAVPPEMA